MNTNQAPEKTPIDIIRSQAQIKMVEAYAAGKNLPYLEALKQSGASEEIIQKEAAEQARRDELKQQFFPKP